MTRIVRHAAQELCSGTSTYLNSYRRLSPRFLGVLSQYVGGEVHKGRNRLRTVVLSPSDPTLEQEICVFLSRC